MHSFEGDVVVFHYSNAYRNAARRASVMAGFSSLLCDDLHVAHAALSRPRKALIVPDGKYILNDRGAVEVDRTEPLGLLLAARERGTPWIAIADRPTNEGDLGPLVETAPLGSAVHYVNGPIPATPEESINFATYPDHNTRTGVAYALATMLMTLPER